MVKKPFSWFKEPMIDLGCGVAFYAQMASRNLQMTEVYALDKYPVVLPDNIHFINAEFSEWIYDNLELWNSFNTIVLSYPPNEPNLVHRSGYALGDVLIHHLKDHQELILISPRPYHSYTVAGTEWMWNWIFDNMTLIDQIKMNDLDIAYRLRKEYSPETRDQILQGHDLWELLEYQVIV